MNDYILFGILFIVAVIAVSRWIMQTKEQDLIRNYTTKYKALRDWEIQLNQSESLNKFKEKKLKEQESLLARTQQTLTSREKELNQEIENRASARLRIMLNRVSEHAYFVGTAVFDEIRISAPIEANRRLLTAQKENASICPPMLVSADIKGHDGNVYHTTLNSCTCPDFQFRRAPCKHMYRLALEVGLLRSISHSDVDAAFARLVKERAELQVESVRLSKERKRIEAQDNTFQERSKKLDDREAELNRLVESSEQTYPWLAKMIADYEYAIDLGKSYYLKYEADSRVHYSKQVEPIAKEKKALQYQCKLYEYQLNYYESLFPVLKEFKEVSPKEGSLYAHEISVDSDYDHVRDWLSDDEYKNLPTVEKNQRALDSWMKRKKSNWAAGVDYERYVGYKYEMDGYRVQYTGATLGLEDMGRDLLVENETAIIAIQCKRWIDERIVHEKHVFQLYGSSVLLAVDSKKPVERLIVTSTTLSDTAKECADYLKVSYRECYPLEPYPMIKCNISRDGSKIYHLPFDQQYDRVVIKPELGEFYAWTVQEAEDAGFRRAYRWHGNQSG